MNRDEARYRLKIVQQLLLVAPDGDPGPQTDSAWAALRKACLAPVQPAPDTGEPKWLAIARRELGQSEVSGSRHNPRIVEYQKATSLGASDDETPWCSSFVNWVMREAGIERTRSAAARSWLQWGAPLSVPKVGAVTIFKRGTSDWQGHVAFFLSQEVGGISVLGGNQGDAVSIARFAAADLLGYRWPA